MKSENESPLRLAARSMRIFCSGSRRASVRSVRRLASAIIPLLCTEVCRTSQVYPDGQVFSLSEILGRPRGYRNCGPMVSNGDFKSDKNRKNYRRQNTSRYLQFFPIQRISQASTPVPSVERIYR